MAEKVNQTKDLTPATSSSTNNADVKFTKKQKEVIKETISQTVDKELENLNKKDEKSNKKKDKKQPGLEPPKVIIKKQVSSKKSRNLVILFSCLGGAALIAGAGALIYTLTKKAHSVTEYTISFKDGNGNVIYSPKLEKGKPFKEAVSVIDVKQIQLTAPAGKYFTGLWYYDSDCKKQITANDKIESNLTAYPGFAEDKGTRNVSFDASGGDFYGQVPTSQDLKTNTLFKNIRTPYPYKLNSTNEDLKEIFCGWVDEYEKPITSDTELFTNINAKAVYEDSTTTCLIVFNIDDSIYTIDSGCRVSGCKENTTTLKNMVQPGVNWSKYGKALKGWTLEEGSGKIYDESETINTDLNLYPVLEDVTEYSTVTFNADGGSFPTGETELKITALKTDSFGDVLSRIKSPTKDGQDLWYWEDTKTGERVLSDTPMTADLTVKAVYFPKNVNNFFVYYKEGNTYGWIDNDSLASGKIKIHFSTSTTETTVEVNREEFNTDIYVGDKITEIPNDFLLGCKAFNSTVNLTSTITKIGNNFLKGCQSFNKILTIPSSVTSIGTNFLNECKSFEQEFTLPKTITSVGSSPMLDCDAFNYLNIECPLNCFIDNDDYAFATNNQALTAKPIIVQSTSSEIQSGINNKWPDREQKPYRYLLSDYFGDSLGIVYDEQEQKVYYFNDFNASNICTDNPSAPITLKSVTTGIEETKTWQRNEFNEKIYFNSKKVNSIPSHFLENCSNFNQEISGFENVTKIDSWFMYNCQSFNEKIDISNNVSQININFMNNCINFDKDIIISKSLKSIPDYFMVNCNNFKKSITIPDTITSIGKSFLENCSQFSSELIVPASVTKVGEKFMYNVNNITSIKLNNVADAYANDDYTLSTNNIGSIAYQQGIIVKGNQGADKFVENHPNRTSAPYRKLREDGKTTVKFTVGSGKGRIAYNEKLHATIGSLVKDVLPPAEPSSGYNDGIWYDKKTGSQLDLTTARIYENAEYEVRFPIIQYNVKWRLSYCTKQSGPDTYVYNQDLTYKFTTSKSGASWHYEIRVDGNILDSSRYTCDQSGNLYIPGQWVTGVLTIKVSYL